MMAPEESRREKLRQQFGEVVHMFEKMVEGKVKSDYEFCPIINTKLPEEICRIPKRMMECPTDSFCCKDCQKFGSCDTQCKIAVELTRLKEEKQ